MKRKLLGMSPRSWPLPPVEAPPQDLAVKMAAAAAWMVSPRLRLLEPSAWQHPTMADASVAAAAAPTVAAAVGVAVDVAVSAAGAVAVGVVAAAAAAVAATAVDVLAVAPLSAAAWGQLLWRQA